MQRHSNNLLTKTLTTMKRNLTPKNMSIATLTKRFNNEQKCKKYLAEQRWHGEPVCPYCGGRTVYERKDGRYSCKACKKSFSVLVGTVFQNTKLKLIKWFIAIHMVCNSKQGISSCQLAREIDVTQKTAWFILQKIKLLLRDENDNFPDVEPGIMVNLSDNINSPLIVRQLEGVRRLHPKIVKFIRPGSRIYTDDYICYQTLAESEREKYRTEDPYEMCRDGNGRAVLKQGVADGLWLQLKRMVMGVYHFISGSLFHRYVYEALFRRKTFRDTNEQRFLRVFERISTLIPYSMIRPKY